MNYDEYQTLTSTAESLIKEKGSKFFGYAFPIADEEEVKIYVEELKALHPKARHHCYAFRLGYKGEIFRANDDGEPSGSAGKPILNAILSAELTNTLVVVVRYFGGTLLGVPGLIQAYKESSVLALAEAEKEIRTINTEVRIDYDFPQTNVVMQLVKKLELRVKEQVFEERAGIILEVRLSLVDEIKKALEEYWTVKVRVENEEE
ncbi:IMPACT family protein [Leadbetterella byssophila]|uniref:IMPACT family protein n=1 Tax=Leadbetterella byssophila TaxID=316068 RepID=UPI0039A2E2C8